MDFGMRTMLVAGCALLAACAPAGEQGTDSVNASDSAAISPMTSADAQWVVTPRGAGPAVAGMPAADAAALLGVPLPATTADAPCVYLRGGAEPPGLMLMINNGTLARIDVDSGSTATAEGARIGDTEERIKSLYPGQVTVQPHKYTAGHYLVVKPSGADTALRLVFETDSVRVTSFRAGRLPEVQWVEGCS